MDKRRAPRTGSRDIDLALEELWREVQDVRNSQAQLKVVREDKNRHRVELQTKDGRGSARIQVDDGQFAERMTRDLDLSGYSIKNVKDVQTDSLSASKGSVYLGRDTHMYADGEKVWISSPRSTGWLDVLPRYDDVRIAATALKTHGSSGLPTWVKFADDGSGSTGVYSWSFSKGDQLFFTVQFPHKMEEGSTIYAHCHWSPSTTGAGNVEWGLEYSWANVWDTFPTTSRVSDVSAASGVKNDHLIGTIGDITPNTTQGGLSSMLVGRLYRGNTVNDTYASDVFLHELDFHIKIDSHGSRDVFEK